MTQHVEPVLERIALGAPAAERDKGLDSYFVESDAFKRVENGSKRIILGNRGSGKSAIFKTLARRSESSGTRVIELIPEDYSYELLRTTMARESEGSWAKVGAYAAAWKYLIYVLVMKEVSSKKPSIRKSAAGIIHKYIRDNHSDPEMSKLSNLISYLKRLEGVKVGKYDLTMKSKALEKLYKLEEISGLLSSLKEVLQSNPVFIFVDELDKGWDASEDAQAFVAGLFQACISINSLSPKLRVYMSLRQELYDNIPALYDDAQKYRDIIEIINWSEPALLSLIAKRIKYNVPILHDKPEQVVWNSTFAETLDYRQNKSFNYIVDRTLHRPREIIQFCSQAISQSVEVSSPPPINYSIISDAERKYSEDRTKDIASEYRFQFPGLLSIFEAFRGKVYLFTRDDLEMLCLEVCVGEIATSPECGTWLPDTTPERLIDILWRVGFLRARSIGGVRGQRRSGSSYVGIHQVGNLSMANVQFFQVHAMFRSYLSLREPKKNKKS
ncbi:hypothetical protein [Amycolatopsis sp. NPDC051102]|uniref:P-loop ATPase, Sll1717 family n=1 Tax=Amycolatopsis sp. NPDC051102 TaxID=3155163 RepID=UPI00342E1091